VLGSGNGGVYLAWHLARAGQKTAAVQVAMIAGLPYTDLHEAVFAHPTWAEGLGPLFANVPPRH
jgi:pyruvate/2-oxoglutarate dehydrogenase complex dihydrolipoamide dehydrogenase (E3) component